MNSSDRRRVVLLSLPALTGVACLYAWNLSQHWFIGDDAFISFRYARHLHEGLGLVWNPGERVEGYTNFAWVVAMAAVIRAGLDPVRVSNLLGVASGASVLVMLLAFSARPSSGRDPYLWVAPLALAASGSFAAWSTGGLETMPFTLLVFAAFATFLRERERGTALPLGSALLFSLASLTRPEGVLFGSVAGVCFAVEVASGRRAPRGLLAWSLPCVAIVGAHLLWRHAYYGAWLPNTFYAKVPGVWWDQGFRYLALFAEDYRLLWFSPLLAACLALRRDFTALLFAAVTAVHLVYVAAVGGDRFEFRFLVVILPYLYWMLGDGLAQAARRAAGLGSRRSAVHALAGAIAIALVAATLLGAQRPEAQRLRAGVNPTWAIGRYAQSRAVQGQQLAQWVERGLLPADLVLCVGGAGALPYYSRRVTVDRRGLSDVEIARAPLAQRGVIAHEREPTFEYLRRRGVVIFDVLNRIVHRTDEPLHRIGSVRFDGRSLPLRAVPVDGFYLIFATTKSDAELERIFDPLPILRPRGEAPSSP